MPDVDLFTACDLAGYHRPNRCVMAPMTRTRAGTTGVPGPMNAEYYAQRASAALIITECTAVAPESAGILRAPGMFRDDQEEGWRTVTRRVHEGDGRIFLQLWHCGRSSHSSLQPNGQRPVAPSAIAADGKIFTRDGSRQPFETPRELAADEIPPIVESFAAAARRAKAAGFDGVELHGSNGYLPVQFLCDSSNRRSDAWGGTVEKRARFLLETLEALVAVWGAGRVGLKLAPSRVAYGARDSDPLAAYGYVVRAASPFDWAMCISKSWPTKERRFRTSSAPSARWPRAPSSPTAALIGRKATPP